MTGCTNMSGKFSQINFVTTYYMYQWYQYSALGGILGQMTLHIYVH